MPTDKSLLLEQINMAINRALYRKNDNVITLPVAEGRKGIGDTEDDHYFFNTGRSAAIEKMQHQINDLEEQNDQLIQLVNFLVENLPALVMNIVKNEEERLQACQVMPAEEPVMEECIQHKNIPFPTRREIEILELLVKGFCAKEIANRLFISESTVITHKKNLREKFNAKNTVELISKAHMYFQNK